MRKKYSAKEKSFTRLTDRAIDRFFRNTTVSVPSCWRKNTSFIFPSCISPSDTSFFSIFVFERIFVREYQVTIECMHRISSSIFSSHLTAFRHESFIVSTVLRNFLTVRCAIQSYLQMLQPLYLSILNDAIYTASYIALAMGNSRMCFVPQRCIVHKYSRIHWRLFNTRNYVIERLRIAKTSIRILIRRINAWSSAFYSMLAKKSMKRIV